MNCLDWLEIEVGREKIKTFNPIPVGLFLSNIGWGGDGFPPPGISGYNAQAIL